MNARSDPFHKTCCLKAEAGRKGCRLDIGTRAEQSLGPVEAQRLDANADLMGPGLRHMHIFDSKHLRTTQLVKANDARHGKTPKQMC